MDPKHSFYLAPDFWREPYLLTGSEAHHLDRVLRIKEGQRVRLFDGLGKYGTFKVTAKSRKEVSLEPEEISEASPLKNKVTIAAGFSRALRRGWFMEKTVELEAHALWLWQADFSQAKLPDKEKDAWTLSLISGAKQCDNPWLPSLEMMPGGADAIVANLESFNSCLLLYEGDTKGQIITKDELSQPENLLIIVGPEGGFSPREVDVFTSADIKPVSMGDRVLRWETAAILALGLAWWARQ